MKRFAFVLGMAVVAAAASTARADVSYLYVADLGPLAGAAPGAQVAVNIYLQETLAKAGDTSYLQSSGGLFAAGYQITRTTPNGTAGMTSVSSQVAQIGAGQSFAGGFATVSGPTTTGTTTLWRVVEAGATDPITSIGTVDATGLIRKVLLGTETFTIGTADTTFTLGKKTSGTNTTTFNNGGPTQTNLDIDTAALGITGVGSNTFAIPITVQQGTVPEPGSMALCGLAACSMGFGAWRRYKAKKAAESVKPENVAV